VVEWGRLLSGYRGEILGRRFESCPPRHKENAFREERVFVRLQVPIRGWYSNPALASPPQGGNAFRKEAFFFNTKGHEGARRNYFKSSFIPR
jgi:hypothetical protein